MARIKKLMFAAIRKQKGMPEFLDVATIAPQVSSVLDKVHETDLHYHGRADIVRIVKIQIAEIETV